MYDIIFIGEKNNQWSKLKERYVTAKYAKTFEEAKKKSFTKMFWLIWDNIALLDGIELDYVVREWDVDYIHIFKNNNEYTNSIALVPKNASPGKLEISNKSFLKDTKKIDINLSNNLPYDIVFISYNEINADKNYSNLLERFPSALRINGVKGIHNAHIEAAKLADSPMIWIVDADAIIVDDFNFNYVVPRHQLDHVHVWRSQNPVNDLVYGYGGIKLFPRCMTINMDLTKPDMTTSISSKFVAVNEISNITAFNTDPFSTWRSAFRECCKLSSRVIDRQNDDETTSRLHTWCTVGTDKLYGKFAIDGAKQGAAYGARNKNNKEKLMMINDFNWLKEIFDARDL